MQVSNIFCQMPKWHPASKKAGQLSEKELKQLFEDGFVIVKDYFTDDELSPVKKEFSEIVDEIAQVLYKAGKIKELYEDYGLYQRLTKIEADFPGANILPHKLGYLPQSMKNIFQCDKLLNAMEQILGTEDIMANPVYCIRYKTPGSDSAVVPMHQDAAYFDEHASKTMHATVWVPLLDTNAENGCLQVIKGGHKTGKLADHTGAWKDTFYIECSDEEMEKSLGVDVAKDTVTCEIPYKGAIFFNNMLPYRSLPNTSNDIRWSFEIRYQKKGEPWGIYDLIDGIQLRSIDDPKFKPDWCKLSHETNVKEAVHKSTEDGTTFDTVHHGPWLEKWPIVHTNRHTDAFYESLEKSGGKAISWHAAAEANAVVHQ